MGSHDMKQPNLTAYLNAHSPSLVIDALEPLIYTARKARIDAVIAKRIQHIQLAIECPADINNALACVRTAEALGVSCIHIIHPEGTAASAKVITQGAFYWVDVCFYHSLTDFLNTIEPHKMILAGAKMDGDTSVTKLPVNDKPLCLLLGNEHRGLSNAALEACDITYHIPMVGMSESLNLSVSAAISLYDTTTRKRESLGDASDICKGDAQVLRAKYYLNSVNERTIRAVLG